MLSWDNPWKKTRQSVCRYWKKKGVSLPRPTTVQWGIHYWNLPTRVGGAYLVRDEHVERRETNSYIINSALTSYFRFWEYTWLGKCISNTGTANRGKKKLSHALDMFNFICWFVLSCSLGASKPSKSIWHFMLSFKHTSHNLHKPPRRIWRHVHCREF